MTGTLFIEAALLQQEYVQNFVAQNQDKQLVILTPRDTRKTGLFSKKYSDHDTQEAYNLYKKRKPKTAVLSSVDEIETHEKPIFFISSDKAEFESEKPNVLSVFINPKFGPESNESVLGIANNKGNQQELAKLNEDSIKVSSYFEELSSLGIFKAGFSEQDLMKVVLEKDARCNDIAAISVVAESLGVAFKQLKPQQQHSSKLYQPQDKKEYILQLEQNLLIFLPAIKDSLKSTQDLAAMFSSADQQSPDSKTTDRADRRSATSGISRASGKKVAEALNLNQQQVGGADSSI
jgi:hypothetical protein